MKPKDVFLKSGIDGFDRMIALGGIPKYSSMLVTGGCGTGKTLFCLQNIYGALINGEKALYISFEETPERLKQHMRVYFGEDPDKYEAEGKLVITKLPAYKVSRAVEGMLAMSRGDINIDVSRVFGVMLDDFKPDRIVVDSLSALAAAFSGRPEDYRLYLEELFDYLKSINTTSYFISEMEQNVNQYSRTGVEEFLADGVIVFYNIEQLGKRQRAMEILKMRGVEHLRCIVPFDITNNGITVHPEKTVLRRKEG